MTGNPEVNSCNQAVTLKTLPGNFECNGDFATISLRMQARYSQYGLRHAKRIDNLTATEVTINDKAIQAAPTALRGFGHRIS